MMHGHKNIKKFTCLSKGTLFIKAINKLPLNLNLSQIRNKKKTNVKLKTDTV